MDTYYVGWELLIVYISIQQKFQILYLNFSSLLLRQVFGKPT